MACCQARHGVVPSKGCGPQACSAFGAGRSSAARASGATPAATEEALFPDRPSRPASVLRPKPKILRLGNAQINLALLSTIRIFVLMKLTFLGTGTSQGVPVIGCRCRVCTSQDRRDRRLRTAAMVETDGLRLVIDAGPDFRYQMLRTGVRRIDAILLTHEHKDHTGGLDDVRAFNFVDFPPTIHRIDLFAAPRTAAVVRKDFDYAFAADKYRGVPEIALHEIDASRPFSVRGTQIAPVRGHHTDRFEVTGYRIGRLAYLTDFKTVDEEEVAKLCGVEVLVVNALRHKPHPSHFNVEEALELIRRVAPRRAYLTHMSHEIGLHAEVAQQLPEGVLPAYDTLQIEI